MMVLGSTNVGLIGNYRDGIILMIDHSNMWRYRSEDREYANIIR